MFVPESGSRYDPAEGQLVRPYTLTNGRTHPTTPLDLVSIVRTTGRVPATRLEPEHAQALELCHAPTSVAEISAHLRLPLVTTKVLLSDLIEWQAVTTRTTGADDSSADQQGLEALLHGLHGLRERR